jgi:tetratricopeptide (TPR) repeat protein
MWSRRSIEILFAATLLTAVSACSVTPKRAAAPVRPATAVARQASAARPGPPPTPAAAQQEFDRALALAHAGNDGAARAQLANVARRYPQFSTPLVNLGILYRRSGDLDAAAHALQQAVARNPHSAVAWTELGVTQRLGGKFQDAEQSYTRAIAADASYAPAYRDRGVLRDLYLDRPAAALADFEQYRKLAGQDKPIVMWIAELAHRTGIKEAPASGHPATAAAGVSAQSSAPATAAAVPQPQARN